MILRELFVQLGLDVNEASFATGAAVVELAKKGLEKLGEVVHEAVDHFVEMVKGQAEAGEEAKKLAQTTGLSTEAIQNYITAAKFSGVATESLTTGFGILSRNMLAAKNGSEEAQKVFQQLGVKIRDANGQLRGADQVLNDIADRFEQMPDGAQKAALAMQALGRGGRDLIPLLNKGSAGIAELSNLSPNLTEEQIEASEALVKSQRELEAVTSSLWQRAIAPLLPAINDLVKRYLAWRKENGAVMAQRIEKFLSGVIKVINGLAWAFNVAITTLKFFKDNIKAILVILGAAGLAYAVYAVVAALAALDAGMIYSAGLSVMAAASAASAWLTAAAPFVAIGAILAGILLFYDDIRTFKEGGDSMFGRFSTAIAEWLKPNEKDPWWLKAMKDLVATMAHALGLARQLGLIDEEGKPAGREKGRVTLDDAHAAAIKYNQALPGEAGTVFDTPHSRAVGRMKAAGHYGWWDATKASFGMYGGYDQEPTLPGSAGGGGGPTVLKGGDVTIQVQGGDPAEVKRVVGEALDERGVIGAAELEAAHGQSG